jgi:hypothetical protein
MKKINAVLHNEKVQGSLIIGTVFVVVAAIMIFTWGK